MSKALDDLNVSELRHELRERQLSPKGKKEELRERLESWLVENGFDVDDYEFVDHFKEQLQNEIKNFREHWRSSINYYWRNTSEISVSATDLERSDTDCERLSENVENSTSGGFHDNLLIGVNIVDEIDNVELKECLTHVEGITPVSDVPVLCPIASFVSVEKRTEEIVDGSTLGGTKAMLPSGEELVEELGKEGCAEKIDLGLNKSSSADVEVSESEIVDRVESADGNNGENEILDGCEAMDCSMSLTSEVRIEPFDGTVEDHPGVDEAVKMIYQVLSWWRFQCSVLGYWGRQGDYRVEWNCRNLRVAIDSRKGIRGPCLVKEVAGWTTAVAARLHFSGEGLSGRWLTRRSRGRDCIPRVKMKPFGCTWQGVCSGRTDLRRGQCYNPENAIN